MLQKSFITVCRCSDVLGIYAFCLAVYIVCFGKYTFLLSEKDVTRDYHII